MGFDVSSATSLGSVQENSCLMDQASSEASMQQATIKWAPSVCSSSDAGSQAVSESGYGWSQVGTSQAESLASRSSKRSQGTSQAESFLDSRATSQATSQAGSEVGSRAELRSIPESSAVNSRRSSKGEGSSVAESARERILAGSKPKPPPKSSLQRQAGRPTPFEDKSKAIKKRTADAKKPDKDSAGISSCSKEDLDSSRTGRKMADRSEGFFVPEEVRKPRSFHEEDGSTVAGAPGVCLDGHHRGKQSAARECTPFVESDKYDKAQAPVRRSCKKLAPAEFTPYVESDKYDVPTAQFERQRGGGKALAGHGPNVADDMAGQSTTRGAELQSPFKPRPRIKPDPKELAGGAGASVVELHKSRSGKQTRQQQEDTAEAVFGGERSRPDPPFLDYQDKSLGTKFVGRKVPSKPTKEVKDPARYKEEQYLSGPIPAGVEPKARNHWLHDECRKEPPKVKKPSQKSSLSLKHSNSPQNASSDLNMTRRRRVEPNFVEGTDAAGVASSACNFRCDRSEVRSSAGYSVCSAPNSAAGASPRWGQTSQISLG
eukprot:gnl/MRDRNA2_/MRDRNA2_29930_c0_seq1.p1 gnl/MRDRNA2_/MRDRNA2_29930_c0~~gnl/MRDRNA2_/MRDRNA2_29930_c0_seq1.p1  ORF type:complete len:546 (-),score=114.22 gnl/MRDRNA2_/MRDRNA2_29930_c0_seq1:110-1747(-)